jgi:hypothetical protein
MSRGSSASKVSEYRLGRPGFDLRQRQIMFPIASGAHPVSCTMGTRGPFPGVKCDQGVTLIAGRPVIWDWTSSDWD